MSTPISDGAAPVPALSPRVCHDDDAAAAPSSSSLVLLFPGQGALRSGELAAWCERQGGREEAADAGCGEGADVAQAPEWAGRAGGVSPAEIVAALSAELGMPLLSWDAQDAISVDTAHAQPLTTLVGALSLIFSGLIEPAGADRESENLEAAGASDTSGASGTLGASGAAADLCHCLWRPRGAWRDVLVAGHSLGRVSALVACGALSLAEAVALAGERGRLMAQASQLTPSGMTAMIGPSMEASLAAMEAAGCTLATVNESRQLVAAGGVEQLAALNAPPRTRLVPLQVSGAFHSDYMRPAAPGLEQYVAHLSDTVGARQLSAALCDDSRGTIWPQGTRVAEVLASLPAQLTTPVRWDRVMDTVCDRYLSPAAAEPGRAAAEPGRAAAEPGRATAEPGPAPAEPDSVSAGQADGPPPLLAVEAAPSGTLTALARRSWKEAERVALCAQTPMLISPPAASAAG